MPKYVNTTHNFKWLLRMLRQMSTSGILTGIIDDVSLSQILMSPYSLRVTLKEGLTELANSIQSRGLLNAIVVRSKIENSYEIVAGNRRYLACKMLGWRKIPSQIIELDDKAAFELSLMENIQRKTLRPIEEANAFKKYVSDFGWGGASDLADKIGKSVPYITKRIRLLNLPPDVVERIINSSINTSSAEELFSIKDKNVQSRLAQVISDRTLNIKETRQILSNIRKHCSRDDWLYFSPSPADASGERTKKVFDKSISTLRIAMVRLADIINRANDQEDWMTIEILMYHKNLLHHQIDMLMRQKKKKKSRV